MDIAIKSRPFTKRQLEKIKEDLSSGKIRRFGAIVNHQKLKFTHNALIAWSKKSVSPALGAKLKEKDYISHIYLRKPHRLWPYVLYTMIHARSREELGLFIEELSKLMRGCEYKVLNTVKELKKTSFNPIHRRL
jgi:DNA-binding Lrp family transcriptional regulator